MNWFDYTRGYDDGREDCRLSKDNNGLLLSLIQFAFSIMILLLQLTWCILKGLAGLLWTIVKLIAGRKL